MLRRYCLLPHPYLRTPEEPPRLSRSQFAIDVPDRLVARARTGCREAFEQIYRRFERPVFTLALRLTGEREEAQDVLQDTMLKLFDRVGEFRGESPFWGWLRQIAVNEALLHAGSPLRADLVLMPHHGSKTSSTAAWVQAVQPAVAIAQSGYRNRFGHPAESVVARYRGEGIALIESSRCGAATWRSNAVFCASLKFEAER